MAEYKNSIRLGVQLESAKDIDGKLKTLIETLNNTKIDVARQLETLTSLASKFKSSLGGNISLGDIDKTINSAVESMGNLNGELQKQSITTYKDGSIKAFSEIAQGIGQVRKEIDMLNKDGTKSDIAPTIITNYTKITKALNDIANAQEKLNKMSSNGVINKDKIGDLQNGLSTTNIGSDNELKNLLNQVKILEVEEQNLQKQEQERIQQLQKEVELSNKLVESDQKRQVKGDSDNVKQLQQEQELLQKQEQAYQSINVLKSNGIISNSEISKLEQMTKSASTLKEINSALSSIGTSTSRETTVSNLTKQIEEAHIKVEKMKQTFAEKLPSGFIESTEQELKKLLAELKQVDGVNFTGIKNSLGTVKTSMEQTNNETKQLDNSLKGINSNGFFGNMTNFLSKIGMFYGIQQVIWGIANQFKDASEYTLTMNKSLTNMQMITGKSKSEISGMVTQYKQLGAELHTTNTEMMTGMEEITRAGIDGKEGEALMSSSIIGSKVSGQSTEEVTQQLIAIKNAFNMTGESMQGVVDMISKMDNVSASSFKEIASAIQRTAFSAQEAGTPLGNLVAYITTVSEKTRKSAETINYKLVA